MKNTIRRLFTAGSLRAIERVNRRNFELQKYNWVNERPVEYSFTLACLAEICPKSVLDVGPGCSPWPALLSTCGFVTTAIDQQANYWKRDIINQHFFVLDGDITNPKLEQKFDCVTCISTLEHIPEHRVAVEKMISLLNPGGHLIVTVPFNEETYLENVYEHPEASYGKGFPYICQIFSRNEVNQWLEDSNAELVKQDFYQAFKGEFWTLGDRERPIRTVPAGEPSQLTGLLLKRKS